MSAFSTITSDDIKAKQEETGLSLVECKSLLQREQLSNALLDMHDSDPVAALSSAVQAIEMLSELTIGVTWDNAKGKQK